MIKFTVSLYALSEAFLNIAGHLLYTEDKQTSFQITNILLTSWTKIFSTKHVYEGIRTLSKCI